MLQWEDLGSAQLIQKGDKLLSKREDAIMGENDFD